MIEIIKRFKIRHIKEYLSNMTLYVSMLHYFKYIANSKKHNIPYSVVKGTNEYYIFDVNDIAIPSSMYVENRTFSAENIELFFDLAKKKCGLVPETGGVFLDVGANIGTTCVYVSKNISSDISILAVEPDKTNYNFLKANVAINDCDNIKTVNMACSNVSDTLKMKIDSNNRGGTKIVNKDEVNNDYEEVRADTIENILKDNNIDFSKVRYVWMDVEGHEAYAIDGMVELLKQSHPCIFMEITPLKYNGLNVSEESFGLLYDNISSIYKNMILVEENKQTDIDFLKQVFYKYDHQCDIFFY